jgi:hypothetical protein
MKEEDAVEEFKVNIAREEEFIQKEDELKKHKITVNHGKLSAIKKTSELLKTIDLSPSSDEGREEAANAFADSIEAVKNKLTFLVSAFDALFYFCRKNIITVFAPTGTGKSTLTANIAANVIKQSKNGKGRKVLILSNEERASDVYARIFCLLKGYNFNDLISFTEQQKKENTEFVKGCKNVLRVIDNNDGFTTTAENLIDILYRVRDEGHPYDCIIIDYYQAITKSTDYIENEWQAQEKFLRALDQYKENSPAAIVLLAQINKPRSPTDFNYTDRLQGRKIIGNISTIVLEMSTNYDTFETTFYCHKSRFKNGAGKSVRLGWVKGKYVVLDGLEFAMQAAKNKQTAELLKDLKDEGD